MPRTFLAAVLLLGAAATADARTLDRYYDTSGTMVIRAPTRCFEPR